MYLHLGSNTVITTSAIVGIFDIDYCSVDKRTREFLRKAEQAGRVVNVSLDLPKSFVVCREGEQDIVYISAISTATLRRRAGTPESHRSSEFY